MNDRSDVRRRKLPVHSRELLVGAAPHAVALSVYCAKQSTSIAVSACARCASCVEVKATPGGYVDCRSTGSEAPTNDGEKSDGREVQWMPSRTARVDLGERAAKLPLGELMSRHVVCVLRDTRLDSLSALFLRGKVDCAPVVDTEGGLIGIISKSDLLAKSAECLATGTVADAMTTCVHALPDHATVAYAFALMAFENLQYVPVVSKDGVVVGLLTALDALRWVTDEWGFIAFLGKKAV